MRRFAVPILLALAAACGTTVPSAVAPASDGLSTASTSAGTSSGGSVVPTDPSGGTAPVGATVGAPANAVTGGTTGAIGRTGSDAPPALPVGSGKVQLGYFVEEDVAKYAGAVGLGGLTSGDGHHQAAAATTLVNSLGGLDGHQVQAVVYFATTTAMAQNPDGEAQSACALFFNDNHVQAVVSVLPLTVLSGCAAAHHVPMSVSSISTLSSDDLARNPGLAMANQIERYHAIDIIVPALKRSGYFAPRGAEVVKTALVSSAGTGYAGVPARVKQAMAQQGLELADSVTLVQQSDASSAVLRFQAEGINHVFFIDEHGGGMTSFLLAAQAQGYYPRLGLSTFELPQVAAEVLPARDFQDAVGVGWIPTFDVSITDADRLVSAPARRCMTEMAKTGEDMSNSGSRGIALGVCDSALLLQAAMKGHGVSRAAFLSGLRALGRSYVSTMTFTTNFTTHRDGAASVRQLAFDSGCRCFHYQGAAFTP